MLLVVDQWFQFSPPAMLEQFLECSRKSSQLAEDFMQIHISAHKLSIAIEMEERSIRGLPPMQTATSILSIIVHWDSWYHKITWFSSRMECALLWILAQQSQEVLEVGRGCFGKQLPKHDLHNPSLKQNTLSKLHTTVLGKWKRLMTMCLKQSNGITWS